MLTQFYEKHNNLDFNKITKLNQFKHFLFVSQTISNLILIYGHHYQLKIAIKYQNLNSISVKREE